MKALLISLSFVWLASAASGQPRFADGAVISVETLPADKSSGYFGAKIEDLPVVGEKKLGTIRLVAVGAVRRPAIHYLKEGASLADAIKSGVELSRLATSRFIIRRGDKLIRIQVGASHGISPIAKDILPLLHLQDEDVLFVHEVSPY